MPVVKHGSGATSAFKTVKVSGQSDVVADAGSDDLTLAAGSNVTITTNAGTDTVTIASTGGAALDGIDDQSSSNDDQITITDTEVVINDDSDDLDFRVESDGNANMLFVDGGTDTVGIGTATPGLNLAASTGDVTGTVLHVKGTSGRGGLVVEGQTGARLDLVDITGGSDTKWMRLDVADNVTKFHSVDDNAAAFNTDNIMVMDLDTGNIGFSDESGDDKITIDGEVALKEQSSVPSGTADYAKIVAMEDGVDSDTKVLLHGDGTGGASTFTNTGSGSNWTGASGDPTTETTQKKFGTAAMYFDGNDSIEMDSGDLGDVAMGTGDFTIEFWMRLDAEPSGAIGIMSGLGTAAGGRSAIENGMYLQYYHASDERCAFRWRSKTNPSMRIDVSWNPHWRALTWYHIAVVRDGNEFIIYQNGRPQVTRDYGTDTQPGADELEEIDSQFRLGEGQNSDWFTGYIDQFRISKGVARYKKAFTPPGAAFPITRLYAVNSAGDKTLIG